MTNFIKQIVTISLCLLLFSCAAQEVVPEQPQSVQTQINPVDLAKQADEAYQRSDWEESEEFYSKLVDIYPLQALYWYRLGNVYAYTNRMDAAIIAYQQAISIEPDDANTWYNLAMAHLKLATISFNAIQGYGDPNDPLTSESLKLLEGILELIEQTRAP